MTNGEKMATIAKTLIKAEMEIKLRAESDKVDDCCFCETIKVNLGA